MADRHNLPAGHGDTPRAHLPAMDATCTKSAAAMNVDEPPDARAPHDDLPGPPTADPWVTHFTKDEWAEWHRQWNAWAQARMLKWRDWKVRYQWTADRLKYDDGWRRDQWAQEQSHGHWSHA